MYWRKELGQTDLKEQIRLSVIRGIDKKHPHAYRVVVGSNPNTFPVDARFVMFINRVHRMDASTPDNLNRFLAAYTAIGALLLAPAFAPANFDGSQIPRVEMSLCIAVHHVNVRNAWEIGLNDIDVIGVRAEDDPIIPADVEDAPILKLIDSLKSG